MKRPIKQAAVIASLVTTFFLTVPQIVLAQPDTFVKIRISFKLIVNPDDGSSPFGLTHDEVRKLVGPELAGSANSRLANNWSSYRFESGSDIEVVDIGWVGGHFVGPSQWYNLNVNDGPYKDFVSAAMDSPEQYQWRSDAINVYITAGGGGGRQYQDAVLISSSGVDGFLLLHEIGHFFTLKHTHGFGEGCDQSPSSDEVDDTIIDFPCWDRDGIAMNNYFLPYNLLPANLQESVEDVIKNVMSYHPTENRDRLTEGQLDRWADAVLSEKYYVTDGRAWFVGPRRFTYQRGTSIYPFHTMQTAIGAANPLGGDVIILKPGTYHEPVTIHKPVTLRATRKGPAHIGASGT